MKRRWIVALGSNLAGGEAAVSQGWRAAVALLPLQRAQLSRVHLTDPAEAAVGPKFANAVGVGWSETEPLQGLAVLQRIESAFGRDRQAEGFHGARPLDLDVIDVDGLIVCHPLLTLPHPRWAQRPFVVEPLAEVCPEFMAAAGEKPSKPAV